MSGLLDLDIAGAREALDARKVSSVELTATYLDAMEAGAGLNCFVTPTPERALEMAGASDRRRARGEGGALEGIPVGIKDLFCTRSIPTSAASRILAGFVPTYESTVTANLWRSGAVLLGKLNMDEFAMGSANVNSCHGPVENPWHRTGDGAGDRLVPGGSSGGSAAAVAARIALAATGTDTGGSIRQPGSFCGIVGMKPSYGRCSRWGIIAFASSLDQAGPLTRTVRDSAVMLGAMAGHDPWDSTSANLPVPEFEAALTGDVRGLRIGVPREYRVDGMPGEIEELWTRGGDLLAQAGAELVEISLPHTRYALPAYYIIAPAEASSNLARYDGVRYGLRAAGDEPADMYENTRGQGFGEEVVRRVLIGTYVLSQGYYDAYYLKAQRVRALIRNDFDEAFGSVDAILTPTAPSDAFAIGEHEDDPIRMYLNDVFTVPSSLAGLPAISVPAGLSVRGLPLGLQLIGRMFDEETVFRVAGVLEQAAAFAHRPSGGA
ncbi:MAG: Asp-tRNA(Asn)/Glu-tRNA(Gln) amidotransferase subunit GatA [Alphaproteobacteria bacterium]|nr:Asp-tRNA(Asn)/Glu-tRNA(Gln) amidotransferase subunit GatA [Alphaproteobacteria bacterium]